MSTAQWISVEEKDGNYIFNYGVVGDVDHKPTPLPGSRLIAYIYRPDQKTPILMNDVVGNRIPNQS